MRESKTGEFRSSVYGIRYPVSGIQTHMKSTDSSARAAASDGGEG